MALEFLVDCFPGLHLLRLWEGGREGGRKGGSEGVREGWREGGREGGMEEMSNWYQSKLEAEGSLISEAWES